MWEPRGTGMGKHGKKAGQCESGTGSATALLTRQGESMCWPSKQGCQAPPEGLGQPGGKAERSRGGWRCLG